MQQTLFIIPPWLFQGPLLVTWIVISLIVLAYSVAKHGWSGETFARIPVLVIVGLVIHFVLPFLMIEGTNPDHPNGEPIPIGLAIRGYGTMMLLAMIAGVGVVMARAAQAGLTLDRLASLAFWMIISGIVGARVVYVVQYAHHFQADSLMDRIRLTVDMTRGGLVVYGSFIGALVASIVISRIHQLRYWLLVDVIAPAFMVGLAIGRIGCLLNGCCFGGDCEVGWAAVKFPAGSAPYMRQLENGQLLGLVTSSDNRYSQARVVESINAGSLAEELGIRIGEVIEIRHEGERILRDRIGRGIPIESSIEIRSTSAPPRYVNLDRLAQEPLNRSLPIHPTQLYGAINGLLIAGILFFGFPYRRREGDMFALLLVLYPIARFLLEYVRTDEAAIDPMGWFTISQWISIGMVTIGLIVLLLIRHRPLADSRLELNDTSPTDGPTK